MTKKTNLLIVSYHLPPYLEPQAIQVGRLLAHLPDSFRQYVVTADDSGSHRDQELYPDLLKRFVDQIRITHAGTLAWMVMRKVLFPFFRTPDDRLWWHVRAYRHIVRKWASVNFDALVTFSYPLSTNVLGIWLKRRLRIPWVAFFSDPWVDSPYTRYRLLFITINSWLERRTLIHADRIVFASHEMHDAYVRKYPFIREKATTMEHSYDPLSYPKALAHDGGRLTFRYLGTLNRVRTPTAMLTGIGELLGKKAITGQDVLFELYGSTDAVSRILLAQLTARYGLAGIVISKGSVPYRESLAVMQGADVLLVIDANVSRSVFLPSKLIDYIGAGKPVLGITPSDSATARVIRSAGGWVVSPNDHAEFAKTLLSIIEYHRKGTLARFDPPASVKDRYSIDHHAVMAAGILRAAIERSGHPDRPFPQKGMNTP
jgi:glycosyltransferase involved in cell wall biosynthesis